MGALLCLNHPGNNSVSPIGAPTSTISIQFCRHRKNEHLADISTPHRRPSSMDDNSWGWFHSQTYSFGGTPKSPQEFNFSSSLLPTATHQQQLNQSTTTTMTVLGPNTPEYILYASNEDKVLWAQTAGKRPQQPQDERQAIEKIWEENFMKSNVNYDLPTSSTFNPMNTKRIQSKIILDENTSHGDAASKTFRCLECGAPIPFTLAIKKFRIVRTPTLEYAEYLVVIHAGAETVSIWRRYSHFQKLAAELIKSPSLSRCYLHTLKSWNTLQKKKRTSRCLAVEYLRQKATWLEEFMCNLVFESLSPAWIGFLLVLPA